MCLLVVVPFQEVWGRSYCRALERLVDIVSEYPGEVEHMFSPSCVSLLRCAGCCGDENLHCVPAETVNVTMQVGAPAGRRAGRGPRHGPPRASMGPTHVLRYQLSPGSSLVPPRDPRISG